MLRLELRLRVLLPGPSLGKQKGRCTDRIIDKGGDPQRDKRCSRRTSFVAAVVLSYPDKQRDEETQADAETEEGRGAVWRGGWEVQKDKDAL